jgi:hypothetical protein
MHMSIQRNPQHRLWSRGLIKAAAAIAVMAVIAPDLAQAKGPGLCADPSEAQAFRVRSLQNHLMVAALTCDQREKYNAFVGRFDDVLSSNGRTIKRYFQKAWGARGTGQLDDYVTLLANRTSMQSLDDRAGFCQAASEMLDQVLTLDAQGLVSFSASKMPAESAKAPNVCL